DIGTRLEVLLGDGAGTALVEQVVATFLGVIRTVAFAGVHVGGQHSRGGVLNRGRGDVAGCKAGVLGLLDEVGLVLAVDVDTDGAVVGLGAGGPRGAGRCGVGHVVRRAVLVEGVVGV